MAILTCDMTTSAQSLSVGARFSAAADTYDDCAEIQRAVANRLVGFLDEIETPNRILEIGCGTGILTQKLAELFPNADIEAIDVAEDLVRVAEKRFVDNRRVRCRVADALELDCDESFSLIASSSSLHWIRPLGSLFPKFASLLSTDGKLVFSLMLQGTLKELHESRMRVAPDKRIQTQLAGKAEVLNALSAAGFEVARQERETVNAGYESAEHFVRAIHCIGVTGGPVSSMGVLLRKDELAELMRDYDQHYSNGNGGVHATYEVLYAVCERRR